MKCSLFPTIGRYVINYSETICLYHLQYIWTCGKGQLISEGNFCVFKSPKKQTKFFEFSKMGQIKKIMADYQDNLGMLIYYLL